MLDISCCSPCQCIYLASRSDDRTPQRICGTCSSALLAHSAADGILRRSGQTGHCLLDPKERVDKVQALH